MTRIISDRQWSQIERKAAQPQFAAAMDLLRAEVADFVARPVEAQELPGGYYHDYFCPQHAVQLIFDPDSPTLHRCPLGCRAFSGEPFDSAWRWSVNDRLAQSALRLAALWRLEGEEQNRRRVQKILLDYAARYDGYKAYSGWRPPNHGVAQFSTLDEAVWAIPLAWSFDMIRATLSPRQQREIEEKLLLPAAAFLTERHFSGIHNFSCWHNAAIGTIGAVTGRDDLLAHAIDGPYGFHRQAREGILADGLWFEGSFSYHFYTVAALLLLAKATANQPRWDLRGEDALSSVLRAPVLCAYPDGSLPATNDCWYFTSLLDDCCHGVPKGPAFYEVGYAWFQDELFGQVLNKAYRQGARESLDALLFGAQDVPSAPDGESVRGSVEMPASGYAILRSQPDGLEKRPPETEQYLLLKYGPHGGGHGHPDKLGITVYAHGSRQAPDLGTPGYGIDLFQSWYRQSISHNSVVLDGLSQPPGAGSSNAFRAGEPFQVADASMAWDEAFASTHDAPTDAVAEEARAAYCGAKMRRATLARSDYFVDLFLVEAGERRRIDWIYRNAGRLAEIDCGLSPVDASIDGEGYQHIAGVESHAPDGETTLTWRSERSGMRLFLADAAETAMFSGLAPGNPAEERQGIVIRQRTASRTAFLGVFHPFGEEPRIRKVTWHGRDLLGAGWAACTVEGAGKLDLWTIRLKAAAHLPPWLEELPADNRYAYTLES